MDASPSWSPNGEQIVYHRQEYEFDEHHEILVATDTLRVINSDGTGDRVIYTCPFECERPSWSPDGTQIAFAASTGQSTYDLSTEPTSRIYLIKPDGTEMTRLTKEAKHATEPKWSPDGRQIVFRSWVEDQIWVVNVQTSHEVKLETNNLKYLKSPNWTPDRAGIIFSAEQPDRTGSTLRDVYFLDLSSSQVKPFFRHSFDLLNASYIGSPDVSPDGKTLILVLYPTIYSIDLTMVQNNWR